MRFPSHPRDNNCYHLVCVLFITLVCVSSHIWLLFRCHNHDRVSVEEFTKPLLFLLHPGFNCKGGCEFGSQKQSDTLFSFVPISSSDTDLL